ncbi:MAG: glycosyl hydrolase [Dysgonamonadaceae bacterium]|jgi:hypothetical protein|nr:glycosyl hydrolase [Dysgonamonadaceae bacterium]
MRSTRIIFYVFIMLSNMGCFSGNNSYSVPSDKEGISAVSAGEFLNSLGAVSSVSRRGETVEGSVECIKYTGLRWLRCGFEDDAPVEDFIWLHKQTGVKFSYGMLSGRNEVQRLIDDAKKLAAKDALLALEGSNEPNNWGITYQNEKGGAKESWLPVARMHRDLYAAVKNDALLKNYPVWATCETGAQTDNTGLQFLTIPEGADSLLMPAGTQYADYANCHNYVTHPNWSGLHDNQTWMSSMTGKDCPVDGLYGNFGNTWAKHFAGYTEEELVDLPKVTTETGCAVNQKDGITEEIQARLYLNLYLSQFKQGWKYTAIYLLKGRSNEPEHENYAFYTLDYHPKQAAHYLHNFTTVLNDEKTLETAGKLNYSIANQPETTHDLLLQKSDGTFILILWGERFASKGSDNIQLNLGKIRKKVTIYDPTKGVNPIDEQKNIDKIELSLSDHPLIVKISI